MRAAVVGLGKAGGALVASLRAARIVIAMKSRRLPRKLPAAMHDVDVLFVAVPDDALAEVDAALATCSALPPLVVHLSGARGTEALARTGARTTVGTFHPLASLDGTHPIPSGTLVAIDATHARARAALVKLAKRCKLVPALVPSDKRARYHAGAVVSANLAVALLQRGVELLVQSGVPEELARVSLARLLRSQADNAIAHPLSRALTGPIARGDAGTVKRHVKELAHDHEVLALYRALSSILVSDVVTHTPAQERALKRALQASSRRP
jgi:predicted short-subunit dehydrogenase-like oxidoreductase (DUF2520 family)